MIRRYLSIAVLVAGTLSSTVAAANASAKCGAGFHRYASWHGKQAGTRTLHLDQRNAFFEMWWTNSVGVMNMEAYTDDFLNPDVSLNSRRHRGSAILHGSAETFMVANSTDGPWSIAVCGYDVPAGWAGGFTGNGIQSLPPVKFVFPARLKWTDDGGFFSLLTNQAVPVSTESPSGSVFIGAGTYTGVSVNAMGNWTMDEYG